MGIRFNQINLTNFMPFYGKHALSFPGPNPVTVILGENMWGKTSVLNAIRWVWYGIALDRFSNRIPKKKLVNWEIVEQGSYAVQVDLYFSMDNDEYKLTRKFQPKFENRMPEKDSDFEDILFMTKNERTMKVTNIQPLLNSLMPHSVSGFFLFDGERLNEFEQLLLDPDSQSATIRESIEDILGLPAMSNAISDVGANHKDAAKRQRGLAAKDLAAQSFVEMAERTEAAIDNTESDLKRLSEQKTEISVEVNQLDKEISETAGIATEIQRLNEINSSIKQIDDDLQKMDEEKKGLLSIGWKDLVSPIISQKINELRSEQTEYIKNVEKVGELGSRLKQTEKLLNSNNCPICDQPFPENMILSAEQSREKIKLELEQLHFNQDNLNNLGNAINKLSTIQTTGVGLTISSIEENVRKASVNLVGLETKRDDIKRKLEGHDQATISQNRIRYNQLMKRLGQVEDDIKEKGNQLLRLKSEATDYRRKISQVSGPQLNRLNREVEIYESLIAVFSRGIERLRNLLKKDIEIAATDVFLQMTTEESYNRLQINDQYGLSIIRDGDKEVPIRSAGAEQIVALSLLNALNKNAVRSAPVIMDTPFGRLDPQHRANVLKYLSTNVHQVILLVHSGEIDQAEDLGRISKYIDQEYRIERISGSRSSIHKSSFLTEEE